MNEVKELVKNAANSEKEKNKNKNFNEKDKDYEKMYNIYKKVKL